MRISDKGVPRGSAIVSVSLLSFAPTSVTDDFRTGFRGVVVADGEAEGEVVADGEAEGEGVADGEAEGEGAGEAWSAGGACEVTVAVVRTKTKLAEANARMRLGGTRRGSFGNSTVAIIYSDRRSPANCRLSGNQSGP